MRGSMWKYARTRPQNFPHRRIAFLSKACEGGFAMFSKMTGCGSDIDALRGLFSWRLDGYWHDHFSFDTEARSAADTLSEASVTLLIINAVAPLVYAYGSMRGDYDMAERAIDILSMLPD